MSVPDSNKKFGLILASARRAQEAQAGGVRRLNPLQDSDDELERDEEEEESAMDWVQAALKKSGGGNSAQLAQQQRLMREALEQDSSVFQYDELYDDLQATRDTKRQEKEGQDKKPKYIHNILKFAERRKLEKERRTERKVQKEREAEKGLFKDKESFVTPAYLNKLEEMKKAEEQERIDAIIEEKNDVAKHKNMGIFFNHLFRQRMGEGEPSVKNEPSSPQAGSNSENNEAVTAPADLNIRKRKGISRGNQYRSQRAIDDSPTRSSEDQSQRRSSGRQDSSDSDADSTPEGRRRRGRCKSRSASPRRGSRSRSPLRNKSRRGRSLSQTPTKNKNKSKRKSDDVLVKSEPLSSDENERKDKKSKSKKVGKRDNDDCEKKVESKESREERIIKLFTKRTVGDKFIEAQQRYFQRKAERLNNVAKGL